MSSTTLRELNQLSQMPASLAESTLILIDYQNTYTRGVLELDGWEPALAAAADVLARAREVGSPVIHVVHDGGVGSPYDLTAEVGQIHPAVAPREGEPVITKTAPNAFVDTALGEHIDSYGRRDLVVIGFMTHMCVTFTSEGAFLRGDAPTVVANACATRSLSSAAGTVEADRLHAAALATIADLYAVVVDSVESLA